MGHFRTQYVRTVPLRHHKRLGHHDWSWLLLGVLSCVLFFKFCLLRWHVGGWQPTVYHKHNILRHSPSDALNVKILNTLPKATVVRVPFQHSSNACHHQWQLTAPSDPLPFHRSQLQHCITSDSVWNKFSPILPMESILYKHQKTHYQLGWQSPMA